MEKYVNYLLQDIRAAHRNAIYTPEEEASSVPYIESIDQFLKESANNNLPSFGHHCGLKKENFPPTSKLNNKQLEQICIAFHTLLESWNLYADMPDGLPVDLMYQPLIDIIDMPITIVKEGFIHIEFCEYEPDTCIFKDFCSCKDWVDDMDKGDFNNQTRDYDPDELPF